MTHRYTHLTIPSLLYQTRRMNPLVHIGLNLVPSHFQPAIEQFDLGSQHEDRFSQVTIGYL